LRKLVGVCLVGLFCGGCFTAGIRPISPTSQSSVISDRNYEIGELKSVFVGDALVQVKGYTETTYGISVLAANEAMTLTFTGDRAYVGTVTKGQELLVKAERFIDGRRYYIAVSPTLGGDNGFHLQVDEGGHLYPRILDGDGPEYTELGPSIYGTGGTIEVSPPSATFTPVARTIATLGPGDENYDIVFNGIDGQSMRFLYREYTPGDLARPSFFQELTYPLSSKSIRFKQLSIAVQDVNAESISYAVMSDGRK
jgi:hypothetical protein